MSEPERGGGPGRGGEPGRGGGPALVILAAGASRRLGSCKALVELGSGGHARGDTPLARLLSAGACLGVEPPLVITGPDHAAIEAAAPPGVEVVCNPRWSAGRTGGVQLARTLRPGRALCLAPVDVPRVPAAVFAALREAWAGAGEPARGWLAPRVEAPGGPGSRPRYGHPVLLGPELLELAASWGPDRPLRDLRALAEPLWSLPVVGLEVLEDLDTPRDLARIRGDAG